MSADDTKDAQPHNYGMGNEALWTWFGIGRASFLIMPRVLMHEMPDEWQGKMAALLNEYDATFTNWPEGMGSRAQITQYGNVVRTPEWVKNYRCPDRGAIAKLKPRTP